MSTTLTIADLDVAFGARVLFTGLDLTVADGDVTAVVGPNGSGKSTLMRVIVGELPAESGSVRLAPRDATIAWLPQVPPDPAETLMHYVRRRTGVEAADRELELASTGLASRAPGADDRYALALHHWLALGCADLDDRLPDVAASVGLAVDAGRPLGSLSGGQAARACLVAVLLSQFDVLLLDEPTNNLDARGLRLMADFVRSHDGPVLIASHDRAFLDEVVTDVVELDLHQHRVNHFTGGWSDYIAQRTLARAQAWESYETYATERDSLVAQGRQRREWADKGRRAVARGGEPDKHIREKKRARADRQSAKGARLERAAERLDVVDQPRKEWQLRYTIAEGRPPADVVATLTDAVIERPAPGGIADATTGSDRSTGAAMAGGAMAGGAISTGEVRSGFRLGPVSLVVGRGDRIGVIGDNGSGKTTLLDALFGELPLTRGRRSLGTRASVGRIDQNRSLLDVDDPVLDLVRGALGAGNRTVSGADRDGDPADVRTLLAKFGLGSEHVARPARSLSMGERTRVLMALFQGREVNVLVLDEPTNHLDVDAIEQLEAAVAAFSGTVLIVSHDVSLLSGIRLTHRWTLTDGQVTTEVI